MGRTRIVAAAGAALALALTGVVAGADGTPLTGSVGPGFNISLTDAAGASITHLEVGAASLSVDDKSDEHNFHLQGPGVDVTTGITETGATTFALSLVDGKYTFVCDAHPSRMAGAFTVGTAPAPAPPPTPAPTPRPAPTRLVLTVTAKGLTLVTGSGKTVRRLAPGAYVIVVRDRSKGQNARLAGAGVTRSTGIAFVGTTTWKATLKRGTLVFSSDAKKPKVPSGRVPVSA